MQITDRGLAQLERVDAKRRGVALFRDNSVMSAGEASRAGRSCRGHQAHQIPHPGAVGARRVGTVRGGGGDRWVLSRGAG
jgi:hypothetical protein